jgi:hypothetical protein
MTSVSAIYGFEFCETFTVAGLTFEPASEDFFIARSRARNQDSYRLTGTVSGTSLNADLASLLEAVLCFIERLDVVVTKPQTNGLSAPEKLTDSFVRRRRYSGGGAVIRSLNSRKTFIECALEKLSDPVSKTNKLRALAFKCIETFRQREPFIEVSYFLLFSGLEAFARYKTGDREARDAAEPISKLLRGLGFNVVQQGGKDLKRAISTYRDIRNAVFHQGELTKTVRVNNDSVVLDSNEYLLSLTMLVVLTVMKEVGFDTGETNWDCWFDRQLSI